MIEAGKIYDFKEEFFKLTGITLYQFRNRKEDLLEWLKEFYDYELYNGRPIRIYIKKVIGEYKALPRKVNSKELTEHKKQRYTSFAIASLGTEYAPNSKSRVAREAMYSFGYEEFGHTSVPAVVERYVGPAMNQYGEHDNKYQWVWFANYVPLPSDVLTHWSEILKEEKISDEEAANAFYRQENGEDITKEKNSYKKAQQRFKEIYSTIPVKVPGWRLKKNVEEYFYN